jgi:hypothetical protein
MPHRKVAKVRTVLLLVNLLSMVWVPNVNSPALRGFIAQRPVE